MKSSEAYPRRVEVECFTDEKQEQHKWQAVVQKQHEAYILMNMKHKILIFQFIKSFLPLKL